MVSFHYSKFWCLTSMKFCSYTGLCDFINNDKDFFFSSGLVIDHLCSWGCLSCFICLVLFEYLVWYFIAWYQKYCFISFLFLRSLPAEHGKAKGRREELCYEHICEKIRNKCPEGLFEAFISWDKHQSFPANVIKINYLTNKLII